ncbi:uncharacterized protein ZBIST_4033 [Zygosaccharomyces bailii]|nr:uncharacterized protein ZBIST_4033 [Zygosaccharomyces bailii]
MGWFIIKIIATVAAILLGSEWLFKTFYLNLKRDFKQLAEDEQSNITSTRKENETALYRNFLIPLGFPLVTGLGLSLKYKIRNGNFADVWNAIMELSEDNTIRFIDEPNGVALPIINGIAKHILDKHLATYVGNVGIAVSPSRMSGFVMTIATMMASIKYKTLPHLLTSLPREKLANIDILLIDSWETLKKLKNCEHWYKLIVVCEAGSAPIEGITNVTSWDQFVDGYREEKKYAYSPSEENTDDIKTLLLCTSPSNHTTSFGQGCLVSGIASFVRSFPMDHELSRNDVLTVAGKFTTKNLSLQIWQRVFAVLLHGGSVNFEEKANAYEWYHTTLLLVDYDSLITAMKSALEKNKSFFQKLKHRWATALLSEGVFTKAGQLPLKSIGNLRCVYLTDQTENLSVINSFPKTIPKFRKGGAVSAVNTFQLNNIRAFLGSRVIFEFYCVFTVMGPIAHTNFYDYRMLPPSVGATFSFYGPLTTSLEGKIVKTDQNPEFDIAKKQGMLCIRGFTIGKPVEPSRLQSAKELSSHFGGGEGWMPLVGIFGLWGQDGCLYLYN